MTCVEQTGNRFSFDSNLCRLCVRTNGTLCNIFQAGDEEDNLSFPKKILSCLNIRVETHDGLPDMVCKQCLTTVQRFYQYQQECLKHDKALREYMQSFSDHRLLQSSAAVPKQDNLKLNCGKVGKNSGEPPKHASRSRILCDTIQTTDSSEELRATSPNTNSSIELKSQPGQVNSYNDLILCLLNVADWSKDGKREDTPKLPQLNVDQSKDENSSIELESQPGQVNSSNNLILCQLNADWSEDETETIVEGKDTSKLPQLNVDQSKNENLVSNAQLHSQEVIPWRLKESTSKGGRDLGAGSENNHKIERSKDLFTGKSFRTESGLWICNICDQKYKGLRKLKLHVEKHFSAWKFTCTECLIPFESIEALDQHKAKHVSSYLVVSHTCQQCYKSFRLRHLLDKHIELEHTAENKQDSKPEKFYETCGKCVKVFRTSADMENHFESCGEDSDEEKQDSDSCKEDSLTNPSGTTYGLRKWPCYLCNLVFDRVPNLTFHFKKEHGGNKPLKCDVPGCEQLFEKSKNLASHKRSCHSDDGICICDLCNMSFPSKDRLNSHTRRRHSEKPHICDVCGKGFHLPGYLRSHKKHHSKNFTCDVCNKSFGTVGNLIRHKAVHSAINNKKAHCDICGKSYTTKSSLDRHVKEDHSAELHCDICEESFLSHRALAKHKKGHSTKKQFSCKLCTYKHARRSALVKHLKVKHMKD